MGPETHTEPDYIFEVEIWDSGGTGGVAKWLWQNNS